MSARVALYMKHNKAYLNKMDMTDDERQIELLNSQAHIWNHIFNFINSMSLKCAIQLGIPDIIYKHGRAMPLSVLVVALPINHSKARCVYRLMRILMHSGFFTEEKLSENAKEEEESYLLTPASRLLLKDEPLSVTPFLLAMLDPILTKPWHHVSEWFQNDDPAPFDTAHGRTFWEYGGHEPRLNHFFNEAMASDARGVFEGLHSLVDVGGGTSTVAKAIANAFPNLRCTVLDLPHVVSGLQGIDKLNYVGGDMFQAIPFADAVLLKRWHGSGGGVVVTVIVMEAVERVRGSGGGSSDTDCGGGVAGVGDGSKVVMVVVVVVVLVVLVVNGMARWCW
ncbi:hypothetical protein ACSBR2_012390 [Camellia fascicularis]